MTQYSKYPVNGGGGGGGGTVSSVGLSAPSSVFSVSNSPIITTGTIALGLVNQNANLVFASPASGGPGAPTFRGLVAADLPVASATQSGIVTTGNQVFAGNKDFNGYVSAPNLYSQFGLSVTSGSYNGIFDSQNVKLTDPSSILRSQLSLGRLDLRDSAGVLGTILQSSGNLTFSTAGNLQFNGQKLTQVAAGVSANDAVTVGQFSVNNIYHVTPTGSDVTGNGSIINPYATIAKALLVMGSAGGTIVLDPGVYSEPTITLPDSVTIIGAGINNTNITNGFSYTASSGAYTGIYLQSLNAGTVSVNAASANSGTVNAKVCFIAINRSDSNSNVLVTATESTFSGGTISGGVLNLTENLIIATLSVSSSAFVILENCKIVNQIQAAGPCLVRLLDCEPFGITNIINGTASGGTPTAQLDASTTYLATTSGALTVQLLAPTASSSQKGVVVSGNLTEATSSVLTISNGTGSVIGNGTSIQVKQASAIQSGYLSSADWSTFNSKQASGNYITALTSDVAATGPGSVAATIQPNVVSNSKLAQMANNTVKGNKSGVLANASDVSLGSLSETGSAILTITGANTLVGSTTIQVQQASSGTNGYLSSNDWNTFNNKQAGGVAITSLTSDVVATGPGAAAATIQPQVVTNSKMAAMANNTVKANKTGSSASPTDTALGSLSESTSAVLVISGVNTLVGSTSIQVLQASQTQSGYLSFTDFTSFASAAALGSNIDGGTPYSIYGGNTPINGGTP